MGSGLAELARIGHFKDGASALRGGMGSRSAILFCGDPSVSMITLHLKKLVVLVVAVVVGEGCGGPSADVSPLPGDGRILAFGDSITYGIGADSGQSYPASLSRMSGYTVINAGLSGEITRAGLRRLPKALREHRPHLVILCHGANDILRRMPSDETKGNLEAMIKLIKAHGAEVILLGVPRPGMTLKADPLYKQIGESHNLAYDL